MSIHKLLHLRRRSPPANPLYFNCDGSEDLEEVNRNESEKHKMTIISVLQESMDRVLSLLAPMITDKTYDEAMSVLALSDAEFVKPLSKHEVHVLACALYIDGWDRAFTYADVLELTQRFHGRSMNITMVYNTINDLIARGHILPAGSLNHTESDRVSRAYSITDAGRAAFKMSILNVRLLGKKHGPAAA